MDVGNRLNGADEQRLDIRQERAAESILNWYVEIANDGMNALDPEFLGNEFLHRLLVLPAPALANGAAIGLAQVQDLLATGM